MTKTKETDHFKIEQRKQHRKLRKQQTAKLRNQRVHRCVQCVQKYRGHYNKNTFKSKRRLNLHTAKCNDIIRDIELFIDTKAQSMIAPDQQADLPPEKVIKFEKFLSISDPQMYQIWALKQDETRGRKHRDPKPQMVITTQPIELINIFNDNTEEDTQISGICDCDSYFDSLESNIQETQAKLVEGKKQRLQIKKMQWERGKQYRQFLKTPAISGSRKRIAVQSSQSSHSDSE